MDLTNLGLIHVVLETRTCGELGLVAAKPLDRGNRRMNK
jgi:hypothetical protein